MISTIRRCYKENSIASIYNDERSMDHHLTGYVNDYDENHMLISHITMDGVYDGYILIKNEDIWRIDIKGEYENKIEQLYQLKKQKHCLNMPKKKSIFLEMLEIVMKNQKIVTLEFGEYSLSGIILEISETIVQLSMISEYGKEEGHTSINIENIDTIAYDTSDEQNISLLYNN